MKKEWKRTIERTYRAAAKRFTSPTSKRLPLTVDILKKIKPFLDLAAQDDRAIWAILCLGVFTLAPPSGVRQVAAYSLYTGRAWGAYPHRHKDRQGEERGFDALLQE